MAPSHQAKDPRGLIVLISATTLRHASEHWSNDEALTLRHIVSTCSDPDFITPNHGNSANPRTGHELYCRADTGAGGHILVPAKAHRVELADGSQVEARMALSCYIANEAPVRRRIWFRKA
jgi:hypothetical protein